jgi:hypothetical protein
MLCSGISRDWIGQLELLTLTEAVPYVIVEMDIPKVMGWKISFEVFATFVFRPYCARQL